MFDSLWWSTRFPHCQRTSCAKCCRVRNDPPDHPVQRRATFPFGDTSSHVFTSQHPAPRTNTGVQGIRMEIASIDEVSLGRVHSIPTDRLPSRYGQDERHVIIDVSFKTWKGFPAENDINKLVLRLTRTWTTSICFFTIPPETHHV